MSLGKTWPAATPFTVELTAQGRLFDPIRMAFYLRDEDQWYPRLTDSRGSIYDVAMEIPADLTGVAAGELLTAEKSANGRTLHYRTRRPTWGTTLYYGDFEVAEGKVGDTKIEVYADRRAARNLKAARIEVENALKVDTELLGPIDAPELRIVGTPTEWGRGFDGIVLMGQRGAFDATSTTSDVFRAHEIAHQWWGNMVTPRDWWDDPWLSESLAEYTAIEYCLASRGVNKAKEIMERDWLLWLREQGTHTEFTLRNTERTGRRSETVLALGSGVYDKGALVLHMLRTMFRVARNDDRAFWNVMRGFLAEYRYKRASTEDFTHYVEKEFGSDLSWFWEQWLYREETPEVTWKYDVVPEQGKYRLIVVAEQDPRTDFTLTVWVHVTLGSKSVARPLTLHGDRGSLQLMLPEKPSRVSVNDDLETIAIFKTRD